MLPNRKKRLGPFDHPSFDVADVGVGAGIVDARKYLKNDVATRLLTTFTAPSHTVATQIERRLEEYRSTRDIMSKLYGGLLTRREIARYLGEDEDRLKKFINSPEVEPDMPVPSGGWNRDFLSFLDGVKPEKKAALINLGAAVAHIRVHDEYFGTGTLIADHLLLTAKHVVHPFGGAAYDLKDIKLHFKYETPVGESAVTTFDAYCDNYSDEDSPHYYNVTANKFNVTRTSEGVLDYALLYVEPSSEKPYPVKTHPVLCNVIPKIFSREAPMEDSMITTVHHPLQKPKKASVGEVTAFFDAEGVFNNTAHIERGSSGGPLYMPLEQQRIVAINVRESSDKPNTALTINAISEESEVVRSLLPRGSLRK